jgi:DeoR/GlpR family transcriptional regulator of sugar metabolism
VIAEMLRAEGSVTVAAVEDRFGVSSMTARRDLAELERRGVARRTHGGAVLPSTVSYEDSFANRLERVPGAKRALAVAAAGLVGEGESVFLDSSTTAFHVAREILDRGVRVTLITNLLPIMELVASQPTPVVELIGIGGTLRRLTRSFVGPVAAAAVHAHLADRMFFSVKGLTRDGSMTDADPLEAEVKRLMIERAAEPVLLIDSTKLESRGLSVIGPLNAVSSVMTADVPAEAMSRLDTLGVRIQAATSEDGSA